MKKIIAAFDGTKYSEGASRYAVALAKKTNSMLLGVFIQDMRYMNFAYAYAWDQPFVDFSGIETAQHKDKEKIDLNIKLFKRHCEEQGVHHKVHLDKGVPIQALLHESAFADILLIDSHTSFFTFNGESPSPFIKDLLADAYCPVFVVPHQYRYFDNIVLCYDGTPSSVYAIKMFSYLFPELGNMPVSVVSVTDKSNNHIKDSWNIKDLLKLHFKKTDYDILHGNTEVELLKYLKSKGDNAIVVMGAYGRSATSRFFQQSIANRIIKETNLPLFITHQ